MCFQHFQHFNVFEKESVESLQIENIKSLFACFVNHEKNELFSNNVFLIFVNKRNELIKRISKNNDLFFHFDFIQI